MYEPDNVLVDDLPFTELSEFKAGNELLDEEQVELFVEAEIVDLLSCEGDAYHGERASFNLIGDRIEVLNLHHIKVGYVQAKVADVLIRLLGSRRVQGLQDGVIFFLGNGDRKFCKVIMRARSERAVPEIVAAFRGIGDGARGISLLFDKFDTTLGLEEARENFTANGLRFGCYLNYCFQFSDLESDLYRALDTRKGELWPTLELSQKRFWRSLLLRSCGDPTAVPGDIKDSLDLCPFLRSDAGVARDDDPICPVCCDEVKHVVTNCQHQFCWQCINRELTHEMESRSEKCPNCRTVLFVPNFRWINGVDRKEFRFPSSKLEILAMIVRTRMERGHKIVIFSEFRGTLEYIREFMPGILSGSECPLFMIHGMQQQPGEMRDIARDFSSSPRGAALLVTLKASGSRDLDLTGATIVVFFEKWENFDYVTRAFRRVDPTGDGLITSYFVSIVDCVEDECHEKFSSGYEERLSHYLETRQQN
ncbi:hypothetical protein OROHE_027166 [Orobanche hederae]